MLRWTFGNLYDLKQSKFNLSVVNKFESKDCDISPNEWLGSHYGVNCSKSTLKAFIAVRWTSR
ncbi:MAG: hypothetical protein ACTS7I_00355 [Candidatus Hodgkinia cicadicola]